MNQKTKIFIIIGAIVLVLATFGLTYAYFEWQSEETSIVITVDGAPISYNAGADINGNLLPTLTKEEGISKDITVKLTKDNYESYIIYYLKINELPDELKHASFKYEMYKNNVLNKSGNFESVSVNDVIPISQSNALSNIEDTYTLYLWIDGNMENPIEMAGQQFSFTLYAKSSDVYVDTGGILAVPAGCEKTTVIDTINGVSQLVDKVVCPASNENADTSGANGPDLFDGMIAVKWDDNNTLIKADSTNLPSNPWYNYDAKMWANAVMVTSATRETYMNASVGTTINTSDILAYWVWIPRYKYKLFNATFASGTSPQMIEIEFESADTTKSTGTTNDTWLTHPAFTFGDEEINGFWMAKFEPSGTASAGSLKVVPGVASLQNQTVGVQYTTAQLFANEAYVTTDAVNKIDSHMLKNIEWGAVAYLSHGKYGLGSELYVNNSSNYYTGRSSGLKEGTIPTSTYGSYTYDSKIVGTDGVIGEYATDITLGINASTTGTIYGVYDMSGGAYERVMGNYNNTAGNSGLTVSGLGKYIDVYTGTTVASSKLGDALGETAEWYSDDAYFVTSGSPWFDRGGRYGASTKAGAFGFSYSSGSNNAAYSFRPALIAK